MAYSRFIIVILLNLLLTSQASAGLFGTKEIKNNDISGFSKWNAMLSRFADEQKYCANNSSRLCNSKSWLSFTNASQTKMDKFSILKMVNQHINKVSYVEDRSKDYWSTPTQFMELGGDCEDYAIAKFMALKQLGFSNNDMRVAVLYDNQKELMHSALIVYLNGQSYLLDIGTSEVINTKSIHHYNPLYSLNETNWWLYQS